VIVTLHAISDISIGVVQFRYIGCLSQLSALQRYGVFTFCEMLGTFTFDKVSGHGIVLNAAMEEISSVRLRKNSEHQAQVGSAVLGRVDDIREYLHPTCEVHPYLDPCILYQISFS